MNYKFIKIGKADLKRFIDNLKRSFFVIGPSFGNGVITLKEMDFNDIPAGFRDSQSPGHYRLFKGGEGDIFSFGNGFDSFKRFIFPPTMEVFSFKKVKKGLTIIRSSDKNINFAFFGMRACDISALKTFEKVFSVLDNPGALLKRDFIVIGLNCLYPSENCFCSSLGTGPEIKNGCDMVITELKEHLLIESRDEHMEFFEGIDWVVASDEDLQEKKLVVDSCRRMIKKSVNTKDLPARLYRNLENQRWSYVADRCLACGNCTQVCPTCFCNSTFDSIDISSLRRPEGFSGKRIRVWDSCFSMNFARVHGGNFRPSRKARYRQWLSHKFGYWIDQFGVIGCVGCGRCITWCPVGIDVTVELEALGG